MTLTENRLCVFCGNVPTTKTREHVVPYWLLEMTGDPRRVVPLGQNFGRGQEPIRYSWSSFVAPACDVCNNKYSELERKVRPSIEALQRREALSVSAYIDLMDWLDKVRIGVWLTRHMIENNPIEITPNFHISSRIAQKDRMLALYVFDSENMGINLLGSDSLIFNSMPSCLGLRINDLLLFNVSSDFFCSKGCGLPHPGSVKMLSGGEDHGKIKLEGFSCAAEISNPITDLSLYKPVVWVYQPIKLPSSDPAFQGGYFGHTNAFDSRIMSRTLIGTKRQGALFRQYKDRVEVLQDPSTVIELDDVIGDDCATQKDIAATVYDVQINLFCDLQVESVDSSKPSKNAEEYRKLLVNHTKEMSEMYRKMV